MIVITGVLLDGDIINDEYDLSKYNVTMSLVL